MKFLNEKEIQIDKVINELDKLVLETVDTIRNHTNYVIVGGYVSILFGRSRMSEDIDVLIPKLTKKEFGKLYEEFLSKNFWSINSELLEDNYALLIDNHAIRMTRKEWVIPNIEIRFIADEIDKLTFKSRIKVILPVGTLEVSPPEIQIAYKRHVLGSEKDFEDAIHLEEIFKDKIDEHLLKTFEELLQREYPKK